MSAAARASESAAAAAVALGLEETARARKVMVFISMPDELDMRPVIEGLLARGKEVYAPKTTARPRAMTACRLRRMDDLRPGAFGILEPPADEPCAPADLDLVFAPALAFDGHGNRLGKGAGYYDRFMSTPGFRAARVGIGFRCQLVDAAPHDAHDVPVEVIVTADGALRVEKVGRVGQV